MTPTTLKYTQGNWTFMREIMTPESVSGERAGRWGAMHYSKASIYPGASGPGGYDTGWMHGLDALELYRPSETRAGDTLFSPFVAAGWQSAVERNMRPAQWLGFLKVLTALGAEYVETGFFAPLQFSQKVKNVQLPQNYVWQAAAPAYAQATLSLWSELLFHGHLVDAAPTQGGLPSPPIALDCDYKFCDVQDKDPGQSWWHPRLLERNWPRPRTYRLASGHGQDLVVVARKHDTRAQFVLVGSIQPQSNVVDNTPLNVTASIELEGRRLSFTVRRQGSVYLYQPSALGVAPSFVQLDGWHEATHFSWWSRDFVFEAELHHAFSPSDAYGRARRVHTDGWRAGNRSLDFTGAQSFVSLSANDQPLVYIFEPRPVSRGLLTERRTAFRRYHVHLLMRHPGGTDSQACVEVRLIPHEGEARRVGMGCVRALDAEGVWQRVKIEDAVVRVKTSQRHRLVVTRRQSTHAVYLDKLWLVEITE